MTIKWKIFKFDEWNTLVSLGKVTEDDLKNGMKDHIPILCPKCHSKIWDKGEELDDKKQVECSNCLWTDFRKLALPKK